MDESLKLSEFLGLIKSTLDMSFGRQGFWVVAELSEWRKSGVHYYGELIEHDKSSKYPTAKIRCNCWASTANSLLSKFKQTSGETLRADMKVLVKVSVNFHESFGLSLNVMDIEPSFTLGDREVRKKEILDTLTKDKIINKNRDLMLPQDFTSVAVITSITAAGKGDFFEEADKLQDLGLCQFDIYEAVMQGKTCANSVKKAFVKISKKHAEYDAVVLIRGGGSQADLDWFNSIEPAVAVCNSQIPVFIGIGHERDSCVLDDICTKSFDTPSKVINYIANTIVDNANEAKYSYQSILKISKNTTSNNRMNIDNLYKSFTNKLDNYLLYLSDKTNYEYKGILSPTKSLTNIYSQTIESSYKRIIETNTNNIRYYNQCLDSQYKEIMSESKSQLAYYNQGSEYLYKQILSVSIEPTLNRGFSISTDINGKYITTKAQAVKQQNLTLKYQDGEIQVEVKNGNTK